MGMGVQYAMNLFTVLPKNNCGTATATFDTADNWVGSKNINLKEETRIGLDQLQQSMDKLHEDCSKESMRNTMMKHEKIFKEQVLELHRLYRVQKLLMAELSKEFRLHSLKSATSGGSNGFWSSTSTSLTSHSPSQRDWRNPIAQLNPEYNFQYQGFNTMAGPSSRGISFCSGETFRIQKSFDLERPAEEGFATSGGAIQDQSPVSGRKLNDDGSDLELSLSIGCGTNAKKSRRDSHSDVELGLSNSVCNETGKPTMSSLTKAPATCDKEGLQRPPWLFQALSLNRT